MKGREKQTRFSQGETMKKLLLLVIIFSLSGINATLKRTPKNVTAYKSKSKLSLDGCLKEKVWNNPALEEFTQRDPNEGAPSTEKTNVWIAYDEEAIYIAARLYDSNPKSIDESLVRRDASIDSDWFYFFVDPYHDKKTGYFFGVNAGGSLSDGTFYNDSWDDDSWDGVWEAKTTVDNNGWCVEMKIPFSQLRFKESGEMTWGVNFKRQIKRNNEISYFVMVPKSESGFVSHFADLKGLNGIKPHQRFEVLPYMVQKAQYLDHESGDPFYKGNQYKTTFGADMKIGLGSNLNLDVTLNPDFGQVEVDPAVVNLSAFETYFPEKRPFFIEGQDIFYYGVGGSNNNWGFNFGWPDLFYSRRIGRSPQGEIDDYDFIDSPGETRIIGAAKLTGKLSENWSVGAISAVTERVFAAYKLDDIVSNQQIEPLTHYGVARTKADFNDGRQGLGIILTSVNRNLQTDNMRDNLSKNAFTTGLDGWTFLDEEKDYVLTGAFAGSYTHGTKTYLESLQERSYRYYQRPDATYSRLDTNRTSLTGFFTRLMLNKQSGNFYINAALGAVSPGFENNDLGFQWMANRINGHVVLGYRWFEPDQVFRTKSFYVAHAESWDFEGNNTSNFIYARGNVQFLNYYGLSVTTFTNFPTMSNSFSRGGVLVRMPGSFNISLNGYTDSRKPVVFNAYTNLWSDRYGGIGTEYEIDVEWRPSTQITMSIGPSYSYNFERAQFIDNIEDSYATSTLGKRSIFGEMNQKTVAANIRLNWTFTPALSLQMFVQPLISVGAYKHIKELARPRTLVFNYYEETESISYDTENDEYIIDPDNEGPAESFTISNPDFNFKSIRANIVLRWEITPGSIFYLVWTHDKVNEDHPGSFRPGRDFSHLWKANANNIFVAKFSYWFDI